MSYASIYQLIFYNSISHSFHYYKNNSISISFSPENNVLCIDFYLFGLFHSVLLPVKLTHQFWIFVVISIFKLFCISHTCFLSHFHFFPFLKVILLFPIHVLLFSFFLLPLHFCLFLAFCVIIWAFHLIILSSFLIFLHLSSS